jgi:hypothetical protein
MGIKNWFANTVAGADAYGESMGRSTAEQGLALGRVLYLGHGTSKANHGIHLFDDAETMVVNGFYPYCSDPEKKPPLENSSRLSALTRAAGVAFAARVAMNAANCFTKKDNLSKFRRSIGAGNTAYLKENCPELRMDLVVEYVNLEAPPTVSSVLDFKAPGTDDLLGVFLDDIVRRRKSTEHIAFQRGGILGFDTWVVPLVEQIILKTQQAGREFDW